jgi:hypothetical protein
MPGETCACGFRSPACDPRHAPMEIIVKTTVSKNPTISIVNAAEEILGK